MAMDDIPSRSGDFHFPIVSNRVRRGLVSHQQFQRKRNPLTAGFCAGLPYANSRRGQRNAIPVEHLRYRSESLDSPRRSSLRPP